MSDRADRMTYRDVKDIVLSRLRDRTWPPDSALPTEANLAKELATTRTTVNRALRELADEGYLDRRRKAGTRVRGAPARQARFRIPIVREEIVSAGADYGYRLIGSQMTTAPGWLAARLGLAGDEAARHVRCLHLADGRPYQFEERWIIAGSAPEAMTADFTSIGPGEWLIRKTPYTDVEMSFHAVAADPELARVMGVDAGAALFAVERITWLDGAPVTFAHLRFAESHRMTARF